MEERGAVGSMESEGCRKYGGYHLWGWYVPATWARLVWTTRRKSGGASDKWQGKLTCRRSRLIYIPRIVTILHSVQRKT